MKLRSGFPSPARVCWSPTTAPAGSRLCARDTIDTTLAAIQAARRDGAEQLALGGDLRIDELRTVFDIADENDE